MKKNRFFILAIILVMSILAAGCAAGSGEALTVGTEAAYPPFEKLEGGQIVGFDIDVMKAVAKEAGIEIKFENIAWDPLFEGVKNGNLDMGISAITVTEERKKDWDFSNAYFEATQLIMVPADSDVKSMADLDGKKIGVQTGTTGEIAVKEALGEQYQGLHGYDSTPAAVDDLFNGRVEAVVADNAVMQQYLKDFPDQKVKLIEDPTFAIEEYGIMVQKGNAKLQKKLNDAIAKIKENGTYDEIMKTHFGEQ
ncbi:MAG: basic amino acid ABC transporter substrate-binding protein [Bacilli bacterium]